MAFRVFSDGFFQAIDVVTMQGSFDGAETSPGADTYFEYGYAAFDNLSPNVHHDGSAGTWSSAVAASRDVSFKFRAVGDDGTGITRGANIHLKTFAAGAVFGTPASSAVTQTSAQVDCLVSPQTVESFGAVIVEYRLSGDIPLIETAILATLSGSGSTNVSTTLTGLTPGRTYEYRFRINRDTANEQESWSAFGVFTTTSGTPTAVTGAASAIGANGATLNAVVNAGGGVVSYFFQYGLTAAYGSTTTAEFLSGSVDTAVFAAISGLAPSTLYHFRIVVNAGAVVGADATFSTTALPAGGSPEDEEVIFHKFAQYGAIRTFYFTLKEPAATNSDRFIANTTPFVAGDVKISKDGGALANVSALPVRIGVTGSVYAWTSTAAEMQAVQAQVFIIDQNGPVWRDCILDIETSLLLGALTIVNPLGSALTAGSTGSNGHGFNVSGNGSGSGFVGTGGASGQICNFFDTAEGAEPTGAIGAPATYRQILQYLKRRFFNLHTQTSALQTMKKDDSVTNLQTAVCSDNGTTQQIDKYL